MKQFLIMFFNENQHIIFYCVGNGTNWENALMKAIPDMVPEEIIRTAVNFRAEPLNEKYSFVS